MFFFFHELSLLCEGLLAVFWEAFFKKGKHEWLCCLWWWHSGSKKSGNCSAQFYPFQLHRQPVHTTVLHLSEWTETLVKMTRQTDEVLHYVASKCASWYQITNTLSTAATWLVPTERWQHHFKLEKRWTNPNNQSGSAQIMVPFWTKKNIMSWTKSTDWHAKTRLNFILLPARPFWPSLLEKRGRKEIVKVLASFLYCCIITIIFITTDDLDHLHSNDLTRKDLPILMYIQTVVFSLTFMDITPVIPDYYSI